MGNISSNDQAYGNCRIDALCESFLSMQQLRAERLLGPIDWQDDDSCEMHSTMNTINNSLMHAALQDVECTRKPRRRRNSCRVAFSVPADEPASPDRPSTAPPRKTLKATFTTFFPRTRSSDSIPCETSANVDLDESGLNSPAEFEDSKVALLKQQGAKLKRAAAYVQERIKTLSLPKAVEVGSWTRTEVQQAWMEGY